MPSDPDDAEPLPTHDIGVPDDEPEWPSYLDPPENLLVELGIGPGRTCLRMTLDMNEMWECLRNGGTPADDAAERVSALRDRLKTGAAEWTNEVLKDYDRAKALRYNEDKLCNLLAGPGGILALESRVVNTMLITCFKSDAAIRKAAAAFTKGLRGRSGYREARRPGGRPRVVHDKRALRAEFESAKRHLGWFHSVVSGKRNMRSRVEGEQPSLCTELRRLELLDEWLPPTGDACMLSLEAMAADYVGRCYTPAVSRSTVRKYVYEQEETKRGVSFDVRNREIT